MFYARTYLWDAVFLDASIMGDLSTNPPVRCSVRIPKLVSSLVHPDNGPYIESFLLDNNLLDYLLWVMCLVAVDQLEGLYLGHVEHGERVGVGVDVQYSHIALSHLTMHYKERNQLLEIMSYQFFLRKDNDFAPKVKSCAFKLAEGRAHPP